MIKETVQIVLIVYLVIQAFLAFFGAISEERCYDRYSGVNGISQEMRDSGITCWNSHMKSRWKYVFPGYNLGRDFSNWMAEEP